MKKCCGLWGMVMVAALVALAGCGGGGGGSDTIEVQSLKLIPSQASCRVYGTLTFTVSGGTPPYSWASGDTSILSYIQEESAPDGSRAIFRAEGGNTGSTKVYVIDSQGRSAEADVTVSMGTPAVIPSAATMQWSAGSSSTIIFKVSGGQPPYSWTVDNPAVADISRYMENWVELTANGVGTVTVTVYDDFNQSASATLTVVSLYPRISPSRAVLGNTGMVSLSVSQGSSPYSWDISDSLVGSLSAFTGQSVTFTARNPGSTVITVTDSGGRSAQATIEVIQETPLISPSQVYLAAGDSVIFRAQGGTLPYNWTISDPFLGNFEVLTAYTARFTSLANQYGSATITLEDGGSRTDTATVTVTAAFSISPSSVTATQGDSVVFYIFGGTSPYTAALTNTAAGTVSVSGTQVTLIIATDAPTGTFSDLLEVYDANGNMVTVQITIQSS